MLRAFGDICVTLQKRFRLEIGTQRSGMHFPLFREREKIRLGEHVFHTGVVPQHLIRRAAQAVQAVREAVNREEIVRALERAAGGRCRSARFV
jgi:hypothetical protein